MFSGWMDTKNIIKKMGFSLLFYIKHEITFLEMNKKKYLLKIHLETFKTK